MSTEAQQIQELTAKVEALELFKKGCRCQGAKKPQQKKKKKKPKIDKSDVTFKVEKTDEGDFKVIEAAIRKIEIDGLMWASQFAIADFVFGMKVLHVGLQIEDLMVPETAPVIEEIKKIANVLGVELLNIGTAQNDWGGKSKGKPKGKKKKKGPTMSVGPEEIKKAADAYAMLARNSEVYVSGVAAMDRSGAMDVTEAQMTECAKQITAKKPELCFVLVCAGLTACSALAVIPASWADKPGSDASALVAAGFADDDAKFTVTGDKAMAYGVQVMDASKDQFAIKEKELVTAKCFAYISSSGLCPDSDDESSGSDSLSEV